MTGRVWQPAAWIIPISIDHFRLTADIPDETYDKLQRATDLLRHALPDGDVAQVLDRALTCTAARPRADQIRSDECARVRGSRPEDRATSPPLSAAVWQRDGGRCAFIGSRGRCCATAFLEFHHLKPFALGGESTVDNIELRCRAHNQREAELFFGAAMPGVVREEMTMYGELGPDLVRNR